MGSVIAQAPTTLNQLKPGQSGVICTVGNERGAVKRRLIDMGLTPGTKVTVRRVAPFGDPMEVNLRGYALSLRKHDGAQITLTTAPPAPREIAPPTPDDETLHRMRRSHAHEREAHDARADYAYHEGRDMKLALVGNPNAGKTTLFNALTGSNQSVGNWPGVTVEKKEGRADTDGHPVTIVDLPGIYSLSPYSMEEIVARDFIVRDRPDAIINIVDATNIERNLYLTVQLLELERPMVVALNFMDEARRHGDMLDIDGLSRQLGVPVVPISARSGENVAQLLRVAHAQMHRGVTVEPDDLYDDYTHQVHHLVGELIHDRAYEALLPAHWCAIKLLEGDALVERALNLSGGDKAALDAIAADYEAAYPLGDRETHIADSRYQFIQRAVGESVQKGRAPEALTMSDKIDGIVTHRLLAIPIFLLLMLTMFAATFGPLGAVLTGGLEQLTAGLSALVTAAFARAEVADWVTGLVVDGVIAGVGGVLTFLPQIALLFLFLSLLEDSGYMARAAFIMDRLLRRFGLSGKAFIPMLMGFGCTVPALIGARAMDNDKDRRMTMMLVPFMSCSARLPVYGLMTAAFFDRHAGLVVFSLYLLGLCLAIVSGIVLKATYFKGETAAFVLELPPYRLPTLKNCLLHVWERVRGFLVKAGTLILAMSVVLWFLQSFGTGLVMVESAADSYLGRFGALIAPLFAPLGFATWQAAVALLTGLIAKEAVVSSMSMFYGFAPGASGAVLAAAMGGSFPTPVAAYAFLVFVLLYTPCMAALATLAREMRSTKWTLRAIGWQLGSAYLCALLVYQLGTLFMRVLA